MKRYFIALSALTLLVPLTLSAQKGSSKGKSSKKNTVDTSSADQSVTMEIVPASSLTIIGGSPTLALSLDKDGYGHTTDSSTSYKINSNINTKESLKITGMILEGGNMPDNMQLKASLGSKEGKSRGDKVLSTMATDLVYKIPSHTSDMGTITYTFSVENGWETAQQTIVRTIAFTLISS